MARRLRKNQKRKPVACRAKSINLYRFIRLVLGQDISDSRIAQRWYMDAKEFYKFKTGKYPVPRLSKLEQLAVVLGVNKHMVFQVANGAPAAKAFDLMSKGELQRQINLLSNQLDEAYSALAESEKCNKRIYASRGVNFS